MFNCPHCGKELPDDSLFCEGCGKAVSKFNSPQPDSQEAVKPKKKGKSLKIFLSGMVTVVVIALLVVMNMDKIFPSSSNQDQSANLASSQTESDTPSTSQTKGESSSVVGTWTSAEGDEIIFKEDGTLLLCQSRNSGAYTLYLGGSYEQTNEEISFTIPFAEHPSYLKFGNLSGVISGNEMTLTTSGGEKYTLTHTSTSTNQMEQADKVFGTTVNAQPANETSSSGSAQATRKVTVEADGTCTVDGSYSGCWYIYTGIKAGHDYGQGTFVFVNQYSRGTEFGSYKIPSN